MKTRVCSRDIVCGVSDRYFGALRLIPSVQYKNSLSNNSDAKSFIDPELPSGIHLLLFFSILVRFYYSRPVTNCGSLFPQAGEEWQPVRCICGASIGGCQVHSSSSFATYRFAKYAMRPVNPIHTYGCYTPSNATIPNSSAYQTNPNPPLRFYSGRHDRACASPCHISICHSG